MEDEEVVLTSPVYESHGLRFLVWNVREGFVIVVVRRIEDDRQLAQIPMREIPTQEQLVGIAEGWILAKLGAVVPELPSCASCGSTMPAPHPNMSDTTYQFDDALWVYFDGGYGMFIDPIPPDPQPKALLCGACAQQLCDTFPWVARLLGR